MSIICSHSSDAMKCTKKCTVDANNNQNIQIHIRESMCYVLIKVFTQDSLKHNIMNAYNSKYHSRQSKGVSGISLKLVFSL